jgi:hypothetical protein
MPNEQIERTSKANFYKKGILRLKGNEHSCSTYKRILSLLIYRKNNAKGFLYAHRNT